MYYFKQIKDKSIVGVESKSVAVLSPSFVKATEVEYNSFLVSLPPPLVSKPARDLTAEIDDLKARILNLEK